MLVKKGTPRADRANGISVDELSFYGKSRYEDVLAFYMKAISNSDISMFFVCGVQKCP